MPLNAPRCMRQRGTGSARTRRIAMADKAVAGKKGKQGSTKILVPLLVIAGLGLGGYGMYTAFRGKGVEPGVVAGKVTDVVTGSPISGVLVSADGASTTTVADGTYNLQGLTAGTHSLSFQKEGYQTNQTNKYIKK